MDSPAKVATQIWGFALLVVAALVGIGFGLNYLFGLAGTMGGLIVLVLGVLWLFIYDDVSRKHRGNVDG